MRRHIGVYIALLLLLAAQLVSVVDAIRTRKTIDLLSAALDVADAQLKDDQITMKMTSETMRTASAAVQDAGETLTQLRAELAACRAVRSSARPERWTRPFVLTAEDREKP